VALVGAGFRIEHGDAAVGVAVGGEHLFRRNVDRDVRRRAEPVGRVAVVALALLADLQHELAVHRELEQLAVLLAVAGEPDEVVVVDEDAVLVLRPFIARSGTTPVAQQVARRVEQQHRRRGLAAFCSGGVNSAARSRGVSVSGRCTTQMRSYLSVAMPATWPRIQLFGSGFGQEASTWKRGTSSASAGVPSNATSTAAMMRFVMFPPILGESRCMIPKSGTPISEKIMLHEQPRAR
jgi:hypothetical protein